MNDIFIQFDENEADFLWFVITRHLDLDNMFPCTHLGERHLAHQILGKFREAFIELGRPDPFLEEEKPNGKG
jgi:hypothetical protein